MPVGVCIMVLTNICKPTTTVEPQNLEPSNSISTPSVCSIRVVDSSLVCMSEYQIEYSNYSN